jgi:ribosomal protein S18 acetylase RimI-like enzyme
MVMAHRQTRQRRTAVTDPRSPSPVTTAAAALAPRVELADHWHVMWKHVLQFVDRTGHRTTLHIDDDGWLSARQNLLVAFIGDNPVGHICFRVQPVMMADGHVVLDEHHKPAVEAYVECLSVDNTMNGQGLAQLLVDHARARAAELHCRAFRMESVGQCAAVT